MRISRRPRGVGMKVRVMPFGREGCDCGSAGQEKRSLCLSDILMWVLNDEKRRSMVI